ncbi:hypothetical protein Taro_044265 [Colocasia esculenta]|uniref:Pentatricopeptide repeat-containing protein n=1 Tax=Colocasia esculenta TaxID=4460 RepID=A0A843WXV8_COLES|nr:hypothetical protein [Colocasia esculenta]
MTADPVPVGHAHQQPAAMQLFSATSKIVSLGLSGSVAVARQLFDRMPERDTIAWNAMLACYSRSGLPREALDLFADMRASVMTPDAFSMTAALSASAEARDLSSGRKLHALACMFGLQSSLAVSNALIDMYGKCFRPSNALRVFSEMAERDEISWCSLLSAYMASGWLDKARRLFGEIPKRNSAAWNTLIGGHMQLGELESAVNLFKKMLASGLKADLWTLAHLMSGCTGLEDPCLGCLIHGLAVKVGWSSAVEVSNSVMNFYAKFGWADHARRIFDTLATRTQVSWNTMMDAHMRAGDVGKAISVFWRAPERNTISWTVIIGGLARNGHEEEALRFFVDMINSHLRPDELTFGSTLQACASIAVLEHGRMVHGFVVGKGLDSNLYVANGLVNMYAKCGDIEAASVVFNGISRKDLVSWNTMLFGFAFNGRVLDALELFEEMVVHKVFPDGVTFVGLLMACSHAGFVEQGNLFFRTMSYVHGVRREADHVICMVDMLGRAGKLKEAHELLNHCSSTMDQQASDLCKALLSACTTHGHVKFGRQVGEELVKNEPQEEVGYVMLSNLYCLNGLWREAEVVRNAMVLQGVKKPPGCSSIEVRNAVELFTTGFHPLHDMEDVYKMFDKMSKLYPQSRFGIGSRPTGLYESSYPVLPGLGYSGRQAASVVSLSQHDFLEQDYSLYSHFGLS